MYGRNRCLGFSPALRTYTLLDEPEPFVKESVTSNGRDTFVACISNSGFQMPVWGIQHQRAVYQTRIINGRSTKIVTRPKVAGMNLVKMMEWCQEFVKYAAPGDLLIWDNLSCHKNSRIVNFLQDHSIKILYIPPYSACQLSPLDNSLFSQLKAILRRKKSFQNYQQKRHNVQLALDLITEKQIKKYWFKCGLPIRYWFLRNQKSVSAFVFLIFQFLLVSS